MLLVLAFFKEDAIIGANKLVNIWIALGLIQQEGEETMEETSMRYLEEFINRNMIQVKNMSKYDRVKSCGMHDLIRNLSIRKAKEEMRLEISRYDDDKGSTCESLYKPRHRVIYATGKWWLQVDQNKHVRSVCIHSDHNTRYESISSPSSYWKSFELVRILDLEGCPLSKFPKTICGLIELRYLGLDNTGIHRLPRSIGKLKKLVVLYLASYYYVRIPNVIWKMDRLRHLYSRLMMSNINSPLKLNTLKNMQTLSYIRLQDSEIEQVSQMTSLCELGIILERISNGSKLFTSLARLENLFYLKLRYCGSLNMEGLATLHRITQLKLSAYVRLPTNFPPNLSHLTLYNSGEPLPKLEKLPKLLYLKIHDAYEGQRMVISQGSFPMLQVLVMRSWKLEEIEMGKGAMPKLKRLSLAGCSSLKTLPQELKAMKNLEELSVTSEIRSESDVYSHLISNLPFLTLVQKPT